MFESISLVVDEYGILLKSMEPGELICGDPWTGNFWGYDVGSVGNGDCVGGWLFHVYPGYWANWAGGGDCCIVVTPPAYGDWMSFRRERRNRKNASNTRPPITATPPTAPPTIAPIGADEAAAGVGVGVDVSVDEDVVVGVVGVGDAVEVVEVVVELWIRREGVV
jgi:hypothetical protein